MAAGEICTCKPHPIRAHPWCIGIDDHSATKVGTAQIGSRQIAVAELGSLQISAIETGTGQIRSFQVGFTQVCASKVGLTKIRPDQMGTLQTSRSQITTGTGTAAEQSLCGRAKRLNEQWLNRLSLSSGRDQCTHQEGSSEVRKSELMHGSGASVSVLDNLVAACRKPLTTISRQTQKPCR